MPSADFCAEIGSPHGSPSPESGTRHRPPRLSLTTFVARPPDLQPEPLMDGGLCCLWSTRPTRTAYYPISVRRATTLLHAAFRRRLATPPLRFANPSPPSSWIRDSHPQVDKHAWQTKETPDRRVADRGMSRIRVACLLCRPAADRCRGRVGNVIYQVYSTPAYPPCRMRLPLESTSSTSSIPRRSFGICAVVIATPVTATTR